MSGIRQLLPAVLSGALLLLPGPGTDSRARDFCPRWLGLSTPEREEVLLRAEARERELPISAECRSGMRSGLRHTLDTECRNWERLMDFEVRAHVDRVLAPCATRATDS